MFRAMTILLALVVIPVCGAEEDAKWSGQASVGWTSTGGNTDTDNKSLSVSAERRTDKGRLTAGADYARGRHASITTEDWFKASAK